MGSDVEGECQGGWLQVWSLKEVWKKNKIKEVWTEMEFGGCQCTVFLPGESQGWGTLVGCRLWGHRVGHDTAAAAAVCRRWDLKLDK